MFKFCGPNGSVEFIELVGVTENEWKSANNWSAIEVLSIMEALNRYFGTRPTPRLERVSNFVRLQIIYRRLCCNTQKSILFVFE